jgi:translation initiation factor IF-3
VSVLFRGREVAYAKQGQEMLEKIAEGVKDYAAAEQTPKLEGRRMIMVLTPTGKAKAAAPMPTSTPPAKG